MPNLIPKATSGRPALRVIDGGLSDLPSKVESIAAATSGYHHSGRVTPGQVEEDKLAAAILQLVLPELGLTVLSALDEMCDRADSSVDGDIARFLLLKNALERLGIRYVTARPEFELVRNGYLMLTWPDRLLRRHPELQHLHPESHPGMALG